MWARSMAGHSVPDEPGLKARDSLLTLSPLTPRFLYEWTVIGGRLKRNWRRDVRL